MIRSHFDVLVGLVFPLNVTGRAEDRQFVVEKLARGTIAAFLTSECPAGLVQLPAPWVLMPAWRWARAMMGVYLPQPCLHALWLSRTSHLPNPFCFGLCSAL